MKPKPDEDRPPFNAREMLATLGPDWRSHPRAWWGRRDHELADALYEPIGKTLPPPAPAHSLSPGFSIFPGQQQAKPTAGDRVLQERRSAKANAALTKLGLRPLMRERRSNAG